jgi:hypothetical protein
MKDGRLSPQGAGSRQVGDFPRWCDELIKNHPTQVAPLIEAIRSLRNCGERGGSAAGTARTQAWKTSPGHRRCQIFRGAGRARDERTCNNERIEPVEIQHAIRL